MENIIKINATKQLQVRNHSLHLDNRNKLSVTGISKILSANPSQITVRTNDAKLLVSGSGLSVTKLDVENGTLEIEGTINCLKYSDNVSIKGFWRKIFK